MINKRIGITAMKRGLLAVFLLLMVSSASQAGPLGVDIKAIPSINAGLISTSYNATTGAFGATGWALSLDTGTGPINYSPLKVFKLTATIDSSGVATNGSVTIGDATAPLLNGLTLLGFAFTSGPGATLEFLFGNVGGSYVSSGVYSAAPDRPLDVMLTIGSTNTFQGNFSSNWTSTTTTGQVREDPAPEPSALLLMLMLMLMLAGAGGVCVRLRRRSVSV
jgi:hypothetical protein